MSQAATIRRLRRQLFELRLCVRFMAGCTTHGLACAYGLRRREVEDIIRRWGNAPRRQRTRNCSAPSEE